MLGHCPQSHEFDVTKKTIRFVLVLAALWTQGCASTELVSQQAVEDKVARIKLGETTAAGVETILGPAHSEGRHLWVYNLTDTSFEIAERTSGRLIGLVPFAPVTTPTNTRALITVRFTEEGIVKGLDIERYFGAPYTNDYSYLVNGSPQDAIEPVSQMALSSGLRVVNLDQAKGTLELDDGIGKARLFVSFNNGMLHIKSINPYDRLSSEYRVFIKRETAFKNKLGQSQILR